VLASDVSPPVVEEFLSDGLSFGKKRDMLFFIVSHQELPGDVRLSTDVTYVSAHGTAPFVRLFVIVIHCECPEPINCDEIPVRRVFFLTRKHGAREIMVTFG
jgi:hypothetical protein